MLVRLACLPLPFICLPLLFICLPVLFRVGFCGAGLSPTSCHLSPTSFHLSPRLGACGRVPGWLVSHFLSFVSHFFSFVRLGLVVGFAAGLSPTCFHLSPTSFICLPVLFICLPVLFIFGLPGWVLVVGFPCLAFVSYFFSLVSFPFICRVPGRLVSHFLSHFFSYVSQFFSFPKQFIVRGSQCFKEWSPWCWMVWSGSRPPCLPLPFICLPLLFICLPSSVLVVGFAAGLSPTSFHLSPTSFHLSPSSFHLSPRLGACGRVPGRLVSHFLSFGFPLPFICLPLLFICLPVLFICLPGWVSPLQWTKPTRQERCLMAYFAVLAFCLPSDFHNIGPRACENCKQLVEVNLMCTEVTALHKSTFAQCVAMTDIWLPPRLTQIGKEVFLNCIALREVVVPTELQRYRSSGFLWV